MLQTAQVPRARTSGVQARTSGPQPGYPARCPEIRRPSPDSAETVDPARTSGLIARTSGASRRPEHPARRPAVRPPLPACNASGTCPLYPFAPRLYILHPLPLSGVSLGLAHVCVRALLIHLVTSPRSSGPLRRRSPKRIQDPLLGWTPSRPPLGEERLLVYPYLC